MFRSTTLQSCAVVGVLALALVGCGGSSSEQSEGSTQVGTSIGNIAPDVTVYNAQGAPVSLNSYRGKPIFLNLWASWCGPCRSEMPAMEEMHRRFGDDIAVLAVAILDSESSSRKFFTDGKFTYAYLFDKDGSADRTFSGSSVPRTYLLSPDGHIVAIIIGARNWSSEGCLAVIEELAKGGSSYITWDSLKGC